MESAFLISGSFILILGMVFTSKGFHEGTLSYNLLTSITALIIIGSTLSFSFLLLFEVYRSIKFSAIR